MFFRFWFLAAYLVGLAQRISQLMVTNLRHSKFLLKILVTFNIINVISLKVSTFSSVNSTTLCDGGKVSNIRNKNRYKKFWCVTNAFYFSFFLMHHRNLEQFAAG
jgi:hypothetical protein